MTPKILTEAEAIAGWNTRAEAAEIAKLREHLAEAVGALEKADALIENLWKSVPWGQTYDLDIAALNEAPLALKRTLAKIKGEA